MADNKQHFQWLDIPNPQGGKDRKWAKDAEARASIAQLASEKADKSDMLHPVNVASLTPSSTFLKNAVIGINGVLYRSTKDTSNLPCTLVVQDGAFVTYTVNGKIAFVTSNATPNTDWEIFTDASIEYWVESINTALAAKQDAINDLATIRSKATSAVQPTDTYTVNGQQYTVAEMLQALATLMPKTVIVNG
jgi:hypothetical protein